MDIIRFAIDRPVSVTVGVILVVMFGLIGLGAIPIQLTPTVDQPIITVSTGWPGRSPEEIVDTITKEQEKRLKSVSNLKSMRSLSREGASDITLEFYLGSNINRALQEVSDALRQVPSYPDEVDEPVIKAAEGAAQNAIAWIIIDVDPKSRGEVPGYDISTLFDPLDREVKPYMERTDGVAEVNIYGGRDIEVRLLLDPVALAQRSLTHTSVIGALRAENRNVSGGTISEGKRDYRVRVIGQFTTPEDVLSTIVAYRDGLPVYVRDVGSVEIGFDKARGFVRSMGEPCLAMNVIRQSGANVMSVMSDVRQRLEVVKTDMLPRMDPVAGPYLRLRQVYDETTYIDSSIALVLKNLQEAAVLCTIVLLVFLRSFKSTLIIALAMPISIIGTFLVMLAAGRTLNVISLAGLAFSTGVVVDNAIVVLENIDRRRGLGDRPVQAVYNGTKEVWGAILAGTLCHVAVFLPILTIREEAGQIFFDLTLALSVSILLSLLVAVTVVPSAAAVLARLTRADRRDGKVRPAPSRYRWANLFGIADLFSGGVRLFSQLILWLMTGRRGWSLRPLIIVGMTAASIVLAIRLMPPLDYLPAGNRNLVFGGLLIPPGLSQEEQTRYATTIESRVGPYLAADIKKPETVAALPAIPRMGLVDPKTGKGLEFAPVPVENMFIGAFNGGMFVGGISQDEQKVIPIGTLFTNAMNGMPDSFGGASQASIFGQGVGGGNTIDMEISGPDLQRVRAVAQFAFTSLATNPAYGYGNVRPNPANFNLSQPEWRLHLNGLGRDLGLRTEDLGVAVRGLFDGAFAGDFQLLGRNVDLKVYPRGGRLDYKEQLADTPISTPSGSTVPVGSVVEIQPSLAPQEIQRIEELPSVTIQITPPKDRPLEATMNEIRETVIAAGEKSGLIDASMRVRLEGSAAKLDEVKTALLGATPDPNAPKAAWQRALIVASWCIGGAGAILGAYALFRAFARRRGEFAYASAGILLLALILGGFLFGVASYPDLILARFVWTILVTYLLMCALFESFLYPFVIMFTVPLGIVGRFIALQMVYKSTLAKPWIAPQNLDVLTMLGFVILIGTVVNNAILIVEQARNFMGHSHLPGEENKVPLAPLPAIAESVRTRVRPIFMTTFTTIGGGLPLVIAPGSGSEMYRGLGAVVVGGLAVSTVFTLILVPMVFSLTMQMSEGVKALFGYHREAAGSPRPPTAHGQAPGEGGIPSSRRPELAGA